MIIGHGLKGGCISFNEKTGQGIDLTVTSDETDAMLRIGRAYGRS